MDKIFRERSNSIEPLAINPHALGQAFPTYDSADVAITRDGIAILSVCGPLEHRINSEWQSYEEIVHCYRQALKDPGVRAVVFKFDSPGGAAAGATEAARTILRLKLKYNKPTCAYSDESCYSAAYELACVCDEIWLPPTGGVGSIGVITALVDRTKQNEKDGLRFEVLTTGARKSDGHPDVPISQDAIDVMQRRIDELGDAFFTLVAENRAMSVKQVKALQAGLFFGRAAVEVGLATGVASWDTFMKNLRDDAHPESVRGIAPGGSTTKGENMGKLEAQEAIYKAKGEMLEAKSDVAVQECRAAILNAEAELAKYSEEEEEEAKGDDTGIANRKGKAAPKMSEEEEEEEDDDEDDDDDKDEDDEDEEDEEEAKKMPPKRAAKAIQQALGVTSQIEALAAVHGILEAVKEQKKQAKEIAKLKAESHKSKIDSLIKQGLRNHQITPGKVDKMRARAYKHGVEWLRSYLEVAPKALSNTEYKEAFDENGKKVGELSKDALKISQLLGIAPADLAKNLPKN